jgi:O-methyltransferase involved in polyketide biosynthesis
MKIHRISECGISLPQSVHVVAADLAKENLVTALACSSFPSEEAAFFSWLGVTVYLTREASSSTLRAMATCGAPGSEIVFTYVDQIEFALVDRCRPIARMPRGWPPLANLICRALIPTRLRMN